MDLNSGSTRQEIAANLRREREAQGISQEQLARRCGMNQSKVSRLERGIQKLDTDLLLILAAGLRRTVDVLLPKQMRTLPNQSKAASGPAEGPQLRPSQT